MMLIDGEKFACDACVRGHRVSNCQHSTRPLQHINKKGRPVSQCAHCRSMRKSRSAHIKCDCGEKTSKCIHLQPPVEGHLETCCCNHGAPCTCAGKKEAALQPVPESDSDSGQPKAAPPRPVPKRRRANTIHSSDIGMTFDQHGHHKPAKHNRAAQRCGPYQLNRGNSVTSAGSLGSSTDNLLYQSQSEAHAAMQRDFLSYEQRQVKSEATSPLMSASPFGQLHRNLPPLNLSGISNYSAYPASASVEMFTVPDTDVLSASLAQSVDWNQLGLGESNDGTFTPSSYSQTGTHFTGNFDFGSGSEQLPALAGTRSTSGETSEIEDFMPGGDREMEGFAASGSYLRQANVDFSGLDFSYFDKTDSQALSASVSAVEDDPAFYIPGYSENSAAAVDDHGDALSLNYW
ncbi:copper fist DNA-binding domain-containing protein [Trichoderma citrinoviride]|uniref:Copper fist DNA-binding domain-containing protein n=1 Tax=Trichoderma citrinoviride TaxID=58853 RepID=A0A2T4BIL8_9HYPO|nr:copper fist DNA-binding domain-containing protein [Trichoderma citrinoviride]PTB69128.1 copper fist DNA-binding domain-containing protein [Trichoderma citrinoviride]